MADSHLLPHPSDKNPKSRGGPAGPVSLALTEFHFLLLCEDRLLAISTLNNQVVFEESLGRVPYLPPPHPRVFSFMSVESNWIKKGSAGSRLRGLATDQTKGSIWCYAEDAIYLVCI